MDFEHDKKPIQLGPEDVILIIEDDKDHVQSLLGKLRSIINLFL